MVFSSLIFMFVYLPVVLAVYYLVPMRLRNIWLFIVNLVFYGWGEPVYILLMVFSVTLNYAGGILVDRYRADDRKARRILILTIVLNLALLCFFKYYDLLASTLNLLPAVQLPALALSLPIGISFYTFQNMSYAIDVYRGDARVQKNYVRFGMFVALFPQLIAGPIVRYKDIEDQLDSRAADIGRFSSGVRRFVLGLAKKVLLADTVSALWDLYAAAPAASLTVLGSWLGIAAFTLQLYFDFSGYSDMAIGLGRMLGFELPENFNYPYISKSVTEFWRRWHISLSTWFRDYVYIPLGGNRRGLPRQLLNICIVWGLTGLWHGASWTFLLWGLYYAVFLVLEKVFLLRFMQHWPAVLRHLYTMLVVIIGWVFFRLDTVGAAAAYISAMFGGGAGLFSPTDLYYLGSYGITLACGILFSTPAAKKVFTALPHTARNVAAPVLIAAALLLSTAYLVNSTYNPFLYFRF